MNTVTTHIYIYTYTYTYTNNTHVHKPPLSYVYIIYVFCHYTLQFSSDLPLYKAILCPYSESEKIWHRKLRKLTFTLKADNSSHCAKTKQEFKRILFFFFERQYVQKRHFIFFKYMDIQWQVDSRNIYTQLCFAFLTKNTFLFYCSWGLFEEQNIDIFGLIGIWCVKKWHPKGGVQYLILDVAFVDDENKEYIHYIHCSMYIIWISVTEYPVITCNHCYFRRK